MVIQDKKSLSALAITDLWTRKQFERVTKLRLSNSSLKVTLLYTYDSWKVIMQLTKKLGTEFCQQVPVQHCGNIVVSKYLKLWAAAQTSLLIRSLDVETWHDYGTPSDKTTTDNKHKF